MNLQDLLDHCRTFLDDRSDSLVDGEPDELFSDGLIVRNLNQAMRILCRRAWVITDIAHPQAGIITLVTDKATYPLHASVLRVWDATPEDQSWPLGRADDRALRMPRPFMDNGFDVNMASTTTTGRPVAIATDTATRTLRVLYTPSATENGLHLLLRVTRLPVEWLTLDDLEAEPETPRDYDLDIADYACGRCLLIPNLDAQSKADGRELVSNFNDTVRDARHDRQRAGMSPSQWSFDSTTATLSDWN